ncbi:Peptidase family M28 [Seinonella peptonophila]|uniref:Peptidase family M28 n=1 Tax=Seinonella peptonophila TaxID=112248 RepID=A0A1M5BKF3_9BACL|nr:M20/M25/M40 family metallo-hydrolase [Seinonella peptonophila]SHF42865.1 Peptidase family M28 [Seinonella peptonophila]
MKEMIRYLSEEVGPRYAGTPGEWKGTDYIYQRLKALNIPVRKHIYPFIGWVPVDEPELKLLSPVQEDLLTAPLLFSGSTPVEGVIGRLVKYGVKFLIPGVYDMPTYEVLDDEDNLLCQVVVNSGGDPIALLNPRSKFPVPAVVMAQKDHERVSRWLDEGKEVRVHVNIQGQFRPDFKSANIISRPYETKKDTKDRVIICAHSDTTVNTPGAYDNASGIAGIYEIARRLKDAEVELPFHVDVIAFSNEEVGFLGADYYVNELKERGELENVKAVINLDQVSAGDHLWIWSGPDEFREKVRQSFIEKGVYDKYEVKLDTPKAGADEWMFHVEGIPTTLLMFWRLPDYHRPTDTMEKIEIEKVEIMVDVALDLLKRI